MKSAVNIHYAKTHLSALLKKVAKGETVIIANAGTPVARLVPIGQGESRTPGGFAFNVNAKFFEPLPEKELRAWEK